MAENQLPMVSWDRFQPTGGQYDSSWVSPLASAGIEAAKLAANPITRAFEQMMDRRFTEQQARADMEFRGMQAQRNREDAIMLARERDAASLREVEAKLAAEDRRIAADQERAAAGALALRDLSLPIDAGGGYSPGTAVTPGTGPLRWDAGAFMPAAPGLPQFPEIPDSAAAVLGPTGMGTVLSNRAGATERAQNNAEQQAKAQAAAQAAQQAMSAFTGGVLGDKTLSAEDRLRLIERASSGDLVGANEEREMLHKEIREAEAKKTASALEKKELEANGFFKHTVPGLGEVAFTLGLRDGPRNGVTDPALMSDTDADSLYQAARAQVARDVVGRGEITEAAAQGLLDPNSPLAQTYANEIRLRANEIASTFGWKREPGFESGRETARRTAAAPPPAPPTEVPLRDRLLKFSSAAPDSREVILAARKSGFINTKDELVAWDAASPEQRAKWIESGKIVPPKVVEAKASQQLKDLEMYGVGIIGGQ